MDRGEGEMDRGAEEREGRKRWREGGEEEVDRRRGGRDGYTGGRKEEELHLNVKFVLNKHTHTYINTQEEKNKEAH